MKKAILIYLVSISVLLSSCIKDDDKVLTGTIVAEIDPSVLNSNLSGLTYPVLTRIPVEGRPAATIDSTLRRFAGQVRVRINLVGPQFDTDQTVGYSVISQPTVITGVTFPATIASQTPAAASATLTLSDAVAGTHYSPLSGIATIPKNTSFAYITINILNAGATANNARFLGITLNTSGTIKPSENYKNIGLAIDQR